MREMSYAEGAGESGRGDASVRVARPDAADALLRTPLAAVMEALPEAAFLYDARGRIVRMNSRARELFALDEDTAFGALPYEQRVARIVPRDLAGRPLPRERWHITRLLNGEAVTSDDPVEARITSLDGRELILSYTGTPIRGADGQLIGALTIGRDITERHRREAELERRAALLDQAYDAIFARELDGTILYWNKGAQALYGYAPQEALGRSCHELLRTHHPDVLRAQQAALLRDGHWEGELEHTVRDGRALVVESRQNVVRAAGSEGERLVVLEANRDVTERRRLERALTERVRELETIFEAMADAVYLYDRDGNIVRHNTAARRLFAYDVSPGFERLSAAERRERMEVLDAEGRPVPVERLPQMRALRGEVFMGDRAVDLRLKALDGRVVEVNVSAAPLPDGAGAIVGAVAVFRDVTERRRLERAVAAHAAQLNATLDAMTEGVILYGPDGNISHTNAAYRALLAVSPDERELARSYSERGHSLKVRSPSGEPLPESDWPTSRVLRGEVLPAAQPMDMLLTTFDGRDLLFAVSGAPVRDERGEFHGAVLVLRDVTERHRLEREATERAAELDSVLEAMPDAVAVFGADGGVLRVNAAFRALFRLDERADFFSLSIDDRRRLLRIYDVDGGPLTPERSPFSRVLHGETLAGAGAADIVTYAPDGAEVQLSVVGVPVRDEAGRVVRAVLVYRDVTERRRQARRTREALDALLEMARTLVDVPRDDAPSDGAPRLTADSAPERAVSQRLATLTCSFLGCKRVGIIAVEPETERLRATAVVGLTPDQEARWWAEQRELEARGARLGDGADPSELARFKAGEIFVLDMTQPPYRGLPNPYGITTQLIAPMRVDNRVVGMLSLDYGGPPHDFTREEIELAGAVAQLGGLALERERLVRERAEARAEARALHEANRRMDEFLSIASHELRTPLTTIKANLQLAERRVGRLAGEGDASGQDDSTVRQLAYLLSRASTSAERQDRLVSDLLDVSRIRAGKLEMRPEALDLAEVVREVVEEQRLHHPGRVITLEAPAAPVRVTADRDRIGQALTNYLTNALKYSPASEPVAVTLRVRGGRARVSVRDGGPGLPPQERHRVWERFHRAPGVEVRSGSGIGLGLGLYICREIVERHGGHVGVQSAPGRGSDFWFTLPLSAAARGATETPAPRG